MLTDYEYNHTPVLVQQLQQTSEHYFELDLTNTQDQNSLDDFDKNVFPFPSCTISRRSSDLTVQPWDSEITCFNLGPPEMTGNSQVDEQADIEIDDMTFSVAAASFETESIQPLTCDEQVTPKAP